MDLSQQALDAIGGVFDKKISEALKPAYERMEKIEDKMSGLQGGLSDMKKKVEILEQQGYGKGGGGVPSSSKDPNFKPSYIEIKGFCHFKDRDSQGVDRVSGIALFTRLKDALPEEYKQKVSDPIMQGVSKSYAIKIPITDHNYIDAIKDTWRQELKQKPENHWAIQGTTKILYPTTEADPITKRRNGTLGRVTAWAEAKVQNTGIDHKVRAFWNPEFLVFLEPELGGPAVELAHVPDNGPVRWDTAGLEVLGIQTPKDANHQLIFHGRQRP